MITVAPWEMLVDEGEKCFTNVCFYLHVERRVIPYDVAPASLLSSWVWCIFYAVVETAFLEGIIVFMFGFVKFFFITGER